MSEPDEEFQSDSNFNVQDQTLTDLSQILPGSWQVTIQAPFPGAVGQMRLQLFPNGTFRGELMAPMGLSIVEGQWQANPFSKQIGLQGRQSAGYQVIPYIVGIQLTYCSPQQLAGVTTGGEQVTWQRLGQPAIPPPPKLRPVARARVSGALKTWQEKLDYLEQQEAVVADAEQKFALRKQIAEARARIQELGG